MSLHLLILYILLAIGFSFICSILEAVIISVTPNYLESLKETNPKLCKSLTPLKENIERSLASILTINTFAHTIGAAGAGAQAQKLFSNHWVTAFSIFLTLAILFLSEIIPKSIGVHYWKFISPFAAKVLPPMIIMTYPLVYISEIISRAISGKGYEKISRAEVQAIVEIGLRDGVLEKSEYKLIKKLMEFKHITAVEIMTEIKDVIGLKYDMPSKESSTKVINIIYSRLPIFGQDQDDIRGYVLKNELLKVVAKDQEIILESHIKRMLIVPKYVRIKTLFFRLLERKEHICAVVDDYGNFVGIVTLEDIIEALLGLEIIDEFDIE